MVNTKMQRFVQGSPKHCHRNMVTSLTSPSNSDPNVAFLSQVFMPKNVKKTCDRCRRLCLKCFLSLRFFEIWAGNIPSYWEFSFVRSLSRVGFRRTCDPTTVAPKPPNTTFVAYTQMISAFICILEEFLKRNVFSYVQKLLKAPLLGSTDLRSMQFYNHERVRAIRVMQRKPSSFQPVAQSNCCFLCPHFSRTRKMPMP